jgi:solute carrier family 29 (equilibrative nucleoside transporter), member 1/2/3
VVQLLSALASTHASKADVITSLESDNAAELSARAFFALSTLFLIVVAFANTWMTRLTVYKTVIARSGTQPSSWTRRVSQEAGEERAFLAESVAEVPPVNLKKRILDIARRNASYEFAVAYVFMVTLVRSNCSECPLWCMTNNGAFQSVFPPITISVVPVNPSIDPLIFSSIHFLVFNIGDFSGRYLCSIPRLLIWSAERLLTLSLIRTLFIPLFLMCNIGTRTEPPLINSDILFFMILLIFGASNGYISSLCMMSAPSLEHNPRLKGRKDDVDVVATVVNFCLVGGLVLGSVMSFGVKAAMCSCNPFIG